MNSDLAAFLEANLPAAPSSIKPGKTPKFYLGVSDTKIGTAIQDGMKFPCNSNDTILEIVRGIRAHFIRYIDQLAGAFGEQQFNACSQRCPRCCACRLRNRASTSRTGGFFIVCAPFPGITRIAHCRGEFGKSAAGLGTFILACESEVQREPIRQHDHPGDCVARSARQGERRRGIIICAFVSSAGCFYDVDACPAIFRTSTCVLHVRVLPPPLTK